MKTSEALLLGALAIGGYFLLVPKQAYATQQEEITTPKNDPAFSKEVASELTSAIEENIPQFESIGVNTQQTKSIVERLSSGISNPKEGVDLINRFVKAGVKLPSTSKTLQKNVTVKNVNTGKVSTGNIAQLADGSIKHISISKAPTDSKGMTELDKVIAERKAKLILK